MLLPLNKSADRMAHLPDQELIKFRVEVISLILVKTSNCQIIPLIMLFDNPNDRLLHLFLQDVILTLSVDFVEELFLLLIKLSLKGISSKVLILLLLNVCLKHVVELLGKRFSSKCHLLAEVIARVLRIRPGDELLLVHDLRYCWLRLFRGLGHNRIAN